MIRGSALALLLLASCDKPVSREEAEDIANAAVPPAADTSAMEARIAQLEAQLSGIRDEQAAQSRYLTATANLVQADDKYFRNEFARHDDNDKAFHAQIDYLRAFHGQGPMPAK